MIEPTESGPDGPADPTVHRLRTGLTIRLPEDPEALRRLEAREEFEEGGEPACLLPRLCPRCSAPRESAVGSVCTDCGASLAG